MTDQSSRVHHRFGIARGRLEPRRGRGGRAESPGRGAGEQTTPAAPAAPLTFKTRLRKALIARPTEEELTQIKAAGFDGVEGRVMPPDDAAKMRVVAEKIGLRIHSVTRGWAEFNSPDTSVAQKTFEVTEGALRTAEAFGADAILLVPCWIGERKWTRYAGDHAAALGISDRVRREDRPPHAGGVQRQRAVRGLHQGPQPRHRHLTGVGPAPDPAGGKDEGHRRAGKRHEPSLGQAGSVQSFRPLVPEPVGQGRTTTSAITCGSRRPSNGFSRWATRPCGST